MKVGDKVSLVKSPRFEYAMVNRYTNYVVGGIKEVRGERRLKLLDEQGIQISRDATYDGHSYYADDFYVVEEWKEKVMEPKFAIGDRIKWDNPDLKPGQWQDLKITSINRELGIYIGDDSKDGHGGFSFNWDLSLVEEKSKSPVVERTVTVKEIVEGEYGNLSVYYKYQSPKTLDNLRIEVTTSVHTPEEMRAMADRLREIADAVEWNKNQKTAE